MSAIGPKRTLLFAPHMSAFGRKADMPFCSSSRCFERTRDFGQRCFLGFAYRHSTAKKSSTFVRRFGDVLADLLQPALIGCSIARCFCIDYGSGLTHRLDALILDLGSLASLELCLQRVTRCASVGRIEIVDNRFNKSVSSWIRLCFRKRSATSKAFL